MSNIVERLREEVDRKMDSYDEFVKRIRDEASWAESHFEWTEDYTYKELAGYLRESADAIEELTNNCGEWITAPCETLIGSDGKDSLKLYYTHTCSKCGYQTGELPDIEKWNYCPNCGVKMENPFMDTVVYDDTRE